MSKKIDINENDLGVLALFTEGYDREFYIREISTILPRLETISRILFPVFLALCHPYEGGNQIRKPCLHP